MYKVVLIDDEEWILKALEALIDWEEHGFKIIGKANSAIEAEGIIKKLDPDIIISDIRMPGMSGLELLEGIKKKNNRALTIFISAYGDFSYAQKALSLGAFEYLLKPVDETALVNSLTRASERLKEMKAINRTVERYRNANLIYELLEHGESHGRVIKRLIDSGMRIQGSRFRIIVVKGSSKTEQVHMDMADDIVSDFAEKENFSFIHALIGNKKLLYLVNYNSGKNASGCKALRERLGIMRCIGLSIGISQAFSSLEGIKSAFKQADLIEYFKLIKFNKLFYSYRNPDTALLENFQRDVESACDSEKLRKMLEKIPAILKKAKAGPDLAASMFNVFIRKISALSDPKTESEYVTENSIMEEYSDIDQLVNLVAEKLRDFGKKPVQKNISNTIVREVLNEIQANYSQKLMISTMAEKYHINTSYLSDLFKRETGKPFTTYLVEYRMNKAAELLREDKLTIFEISEKVGYDDYFHFSKLFKKYRNVTPGAFRKKSDFFIT